MANQILGGVKGLFAQNIHLFWDKDQSDVESEQLGMFRAS